MTKEDLADLFFEAATEWDNSADRKSSTGYGISAGEFRDNADKLKEIGRLLRGY